MRDTWTFLDVEDYNLLYSFGEVLKKKGKQIRLIGENSSVGQEDLRGKEIMEVRQNKARKRRAYYLIWIVYRYILNCRTYADTEPYRNKEILDKYHLTAYIKNIYLGHDEDSLVLGNGIVVSLEKIKFRKPEDIDIILQILYGRLGFYEQFECFINVTHERKEPVRQLRAEKAYKGYKDLQVVLSMSNFQL